MSHHAKLVNHLNELKRDKQKAQAAGQVALVNALSLCIEDTEKEIMAVFDTKNTMKNYTIIDRVINILTFIAVIVVWLTL